MIAKAVEYRFATFKQGPKLIGPALRGLVGIREKYKRYWMGQRVEIRYPCAKYRRRGLPSDRVRYPLGVDGRFRSGGGGGGAVAAVRHVSYVTNKAVVVGR